MSPHACVADVERTAWILFPGPPGRYLAPRCGGLEHATTSVSFKEKSRRRDTLEIGNKDDALRGMASPSRIEYSRTGFVATRVIADSNQAIRSTGTLRYSSLMSALIGKMCFSLNKLTVKYILILQRLPLVAPLPAPLPAPVSQNRGRIATSYSTP